MPEISHRCPSCGVSLRDFGEGVMFCPECGKPLAGSPKDEGNDDGKLAEKSVDTAAVSSPPGAVVDGQKPVADSDATPGKAPGRVPDERARTRERTREVLERASKMTRGAIEDNVKRVEKIQHVSSVVLEEASYDPSLRFVLVALGLFVLFVILLILSKVMG